jgi:hypothetical protein
MIDEAGSVKCFSISVFRDMAKNKSQRADDASEISTKKANTSSDAQDSRYIIDIPSFWSKEDLLDLRDYLEKTEI